MESTYTLQHIGVDGLFNPGENPLKINRKAEQLVVV